MDKRPRLMKFIPYQISRLGSLAFVAVFCGSATMASAGSATWLANPATGNWNTATNWNPATVPNGPSDVATFSVSNQRNVEVTNSIVLNSIVFSPDASAFTITSSSSFASVLINGAGVINNSALAQNFFVNAVGRDRGDLSFAGTATAGDAIYSMAGGPVSNSFGGNTSFFNTSTADTGTFFLDGGTASGASGGGVLFFDSSTAGSANFTINAGMVAGATGGHLEFSNTSTAGSSNIIVNGSQIADGGVVFFLDDSTGGTANVVLLGNATLDLTLHSPAGVSLASVQGDGLVSLGSSRLTINTRLVVPFSGVISGFGSLVKEGRGTYDLRNGSTYTGGTRIKEGTLLANNTNGSATGTGPVHVASGALGGTGTIAGPVTVGSNTPGNGSFLTPGQSFTRPGKLTLLNRLTFRSDGFFNVGLGAQSTFSQVVANGVRIDTEGTFAFFNNRGVTVPVGTVLVLIDNTSVRPIDGQFENLPDGLVFTDHANTFQVSYTGGDGNDLTLTRLP